MMDDGHEDFETQVVNMEQVYRLQVQKNLYFIGQINCHISGSGNETSGCLGDFGLEAAGGQDTFWPPYLKLA